jgi:putative transposase
MGYTMRGIWGVPMRWKSCDRMEEHLKFVARLLDGEKLAAIYREFGISLRAG